MRSFTPCSHWWISRRDFPWSIHERWLQNYPDSVPLWGQWHSLLSYIWLPSDTIAGIQQYTQAFPANVSSLASCVYYDGTMPISVPLQSHKQLYIQNTTWLHAYNVHVHIMKIHLRTLLTDFIWDKPTVTARPDIVHNLCVLSYILYKVKWACLTILACFSRSRKGERFNAEVPTGVTAPPANSARAARASMILLIPWRRPVLRNCERWEITVAAVTQMPAGCRCCSFHFLNNLGACMVHLILFTWPVYVYTSICMYLLHENIIFTSYEHIYTQYMEILHQSISCPGSVLRSSGQKYQETSDIRYVYVYILWNNCTKRTKNAL